MAETCLFGAETEYALAAVALDGSAAHADVHDAFMRCACAMLPHLPDEAPDDCSSVFLANGGRLYVDGGYRIEYSSPEVTSPWELVRYLRAGDVMCERVARRLADEHPEWREVFCSRANVDYLHRTAWGAHESYLIRQCRPLDLRDALVPFLVSRIVYSGAGGFDAYDGGLRFLLMPRAAFTTQTVSEDTMRDRPVFSSRDEPLARAPYRRLHVACGETLSSDLGLFLRTGATALVVRMLERDPTVVADLALQYPASSLRAVAADPICRRRVPLADGRRLTAIEIQRRYLELVQRGSGQGGLPAWTDEVCARWREVLDGLERDPASLRTSLDWTIKWRVYRRYLDQHGLGWRKLAAVNRALGCRWARHAARRVGEPPAGAADGDDGSAARSIPDAADADVERCRLSPGDLSHALECRTRLFEIDLRWGELGPRGVFRALDERGALSHRLEGCDHVDRAVEQPPDVGRARLRGEVVRRLCETGRRIVCRWGGIDDIDEGRCLDLTDPFEQEERWTAPSRAAPRAVV